MTTVIRTSLLIGLAFTQNYLVGDILKSEVFTENTTNTSCMIYQPYLGVVQDLESLDIKSDKFEITDEKVLILNDNVQIDFPEGILKAGKARLDQENGLVNFKKGGELILENYFFNSNEGAFDKNKLFVDFTDGETFLNNRGLVISFKKLTGNLDDQITFEEISMTSCLEPSNGWQLNAESITIDDNTMRG